MTRVLLSDVRASTADYFGMSERSLLDETHIWRISAARQIGMYVGRELTGRSMLQIAHAFNRSDHTTARHGIVKVSKALERGDESVKLVVTAIRESAMQRAAARSVPMLTAA